MFNDRQNNNKCCRKQYLDDVKVNLLLLASKAREPNQDTRGTSSSAQTSTLETVALVPFISVLSLAVDFLERLICRSLSLVTMKETYKVYTYIPNVDELRHFQS